MAGRPDAMGTQLSAMPAVPALNRRLRGQLDAAADLDVESDHERVRDSKKARRQELTSSPKAPRLSSAFNYADQLADHAPALWSPAVREVYAGSVTTTQSVGFEDDYFRKDRRPTQLPSTKRGGEPPRRGQLAHAEGQTGPPGESGGWDSFFVQVGYGMNSGEFEIFLSQPEAWAATATRKGRGEVRVGRLDSEMKAELAKTKDKNNQNWLRNSAVEAATRSGLSSRALMRMGWVITEKPTGLKARLVVQGFTGPDLVCLRRESPTASRRARQLYFALCASLGFHIRKGDVTSAFLQGDASELERDVLCELVKELAEALGVPRGQAVRLRKAVYGLVNAPRQWWSGVRSKMTNSGWVESSIEPCLWKLLDSQGQLVGLCECMLTTSSSASTRRPCPPPKSCGCYKASTNGVRGRTRTSRCAAYEHDSCTPVAGGVTFSWISTSTPERSQTSRSRRRVTTGTPSRAGRPRSSGQPSALCNGLLRRRNPIPCRPLLEKPPWAPSRR